MWLYICRQAKDVIKAIKKRLGSKHTNTQLYAVLVSIDSFLRNMFLHLYFLSSLIRFIRQDERKFFIEVVFLFFILNVFTC